MEEEPASRAMPAREAWAPIPNKTGYFFGWHDVQGVHTRIGDFTLKHYVWRKAGEAKPQWATAWILNIFKPIGADSFSCLCSFYDVWKLSDIIDFNKDPRQLLGDLYRRPSMRLATRGRRRGAPSRAPRA